MPRPRKRGLAYEPGPIDTELVSKAMGVFPETEPEVYLFLCKALNHPLPVPWTEHSDKKGRVFYWNPASRHSSWSHPLSSTHKSLVHAYRRIKAKPPGEERSQAVLAELETFHKQGAEEIEQWRVSHAPDGSPYYYKTGTQQTRWDNPRDELVSHQELRITMLSELLEEPAEAEQFELDEPPVAIEDGDATADSSKDAAKRDMDVTIFPDADETMPAKSLPPGIDTEALEEEFDKSIRSKADLEESGRYTEPFEATWGSTDMTELKPGTKVIPFPPATPIGSLLQLSSLLEDKKPQETGLIDKIINVGWLQPDEIALHLGVDFDDPTDATCFAILRPILTAEWPVPWVNIGYHHGRTDFRHPGTGEKRRQHPLFWFFNQLLKFLREQSIQDVNLIDVMSSHILSEASPQHVRNRLGVWEGPMEDPTRQDGKAIWERILPGRDGACVVIDVRTDDPRVEAAANIIAHFHAWQHLWQGFAGQEPFPVSLDRIPHLATQLGESVVVASGNRADKEWVLHQWNFELEILSQSVDRMKRPWTKPEAELQPKVAQLLGDVYGRAVKAAAYELMPYAKDEKIAWELLRINYRYASTRIEEEDDASEPRDEYFDEIERDRQLSESEYTDDEVAEPLEDADVPFWPPEEDVESLSAAGSCISHRRVRRRTRGGYAIQDGVGRGDAEEADNEWYEDDDVEPPSDEELIVDTPVETPRPVYADYLGLKYTDQASWAEHGLRPSTPPHVPPEPLKPYLARSVPETHKNREAKGFDPDIWGGGKFLKVGIIKPYVANLGWRCHLEIRQAMHTEDREAIKNNLKLATEAFCQSIEDSKLSAANVISSLDAEGDQAPWKQLELAPLELPRLVPTASGEKTRDEVKKEEMDRFHGDLKKSAGKFDDSVVDGRGPAGVKVDRNLSEAADITSGTRGDLKRANLPVKERLKGDDMSVFSIAMKGCVPPVPSPEGRPLPVPDYLVASDAIAATSSGPKPKRTSSSGPDRTSMARLNLKFRPNSADARARKPPVPVSLVPERPDTLAQMAAEEVLRWLSRKCGRMEAVLKAFNSGDDGYITREEWAEGLRNLGYEKMEHADAIFTYLDTRGHHVLTYSDLQVRLRLQVTEGVKDRLPSDAEAACLLHEVWTSELDSVITEAMREVLAEAFQYPQRPLDAGLPDVKSWLKEKRRLSRLARGEKLGDLTGETDETESDLLDDVMRDIRDGSPASSRSPSGKRKKKKGKKGKFAALASAAASGASARRRNRSRGKSSGSDRSKSPGGRSGRSGGKSPGGKSSGGKSPGGKSGGKSPGGRSGGKSPGGRSTSSGSSGRGRSPGSRSSTSKRKGKKKLKNKAGMLGKLLASHDSELSGDASSSGASVGRTSSRSRSSKKGSSSKGGSPSPKRSARSIQGDSASSWRGSPSAKKKSKGKTKGQGKLGRTGGSPDLRTPPLSSASSRRNRQTPSPHQSGSTWAPSRDGKRATSLPHAKAKQRPGRAGVPVRPGRDVAGRPGRDIAGGTGRDIAGRGRTGPATGPASSVTGKPSAKPGWVGDEHDEFGKHDDLGTEEFDDLEAPSVWATRIGALPSNPSVYSRRTRGEVPHSVGPPAHSDDLSRRKSGLLPYMPQRPEDVIRTYGHIFHLLNDPSVKKRMPKQKHSVHVSMPRLPAAGLSITGAETGAPPGFGGNGGRSVPDLASAGMSGSPGPLDTQAYVSLPPLAKSAPERRRPPDPLGGDTRRGIWAG